MHEAGIAIEIARIAVETLESSGAVGRIAELHLKIGRWSGVEPSALTFALEALADGTELQGVKVVIDHVEPTFHCPKCEKDYVASERMDPCPGCGGLDGELVCGDELLITHIEVED